jgi:hypothetical protein
VWHWPCEYGDIKSDLTTIGTHLQTPLHSHAKASVDVLVAEIRETARRELDTLRGTLNTRLAALERAIDVDDQPALARIVEQLCAAAADQTEVAVKEARKDARKEADDTASRQLSALRDQADAELEAARAQLEKLRADFASSSARADALKSQLEQQIADEQKVTAQTVVALADAERAADVARAEAMTLSAGLEDARAKIAEVEQERANLMLARDIAEAHLEGESKGRAAAAAELEAARAKLLHAESDARACRLELQRAADRIRALEQASRMQGGTGSIGAVTADDDAGLEQVRAGLQALTGVTSGRALLTALLERLALLFPRVALCAVRPQGLVVWESRGFDPPLKPKAPLPLDAGSPLQRVIVDASVDVAKTLEGEMLAGLAGLPVEYALAMPIVAMDKGAAVFYAECAPELISASAAEAVARILVDHVRRRVRPQQQIADN